MIDLIGRPYRLVLMALERRSNRLHSSGLCVLERMNIPTPEFKDDWYNQSVRQYGRDLLKWGVELTSPVTMGTCCC